MASRNGSPAKTLPPPVFPRMPYRLAGPEAWAKFRADELRAQEEMKDPRRALPPELQAALDEGEADRAKRALRDALDDWANPARRAARAKTP